MTPVEFPEQTKVLQKPENMTDEECSSLPIWNGDQQQCISCWKGNWKERLVFLFTGRVYLSVLSGRTQPPVWVTPLNSNRGPSRSSAWARISRIAHGKRINVDPLLSPMLSAMQDINTVKGRAAAEHRINEFIKDLDKAGFQIVSKYGGTIVEIPENTATKATEPQTSNDQQ